MNCLYIGYIICALLLTADDDDDSSTDYYIYIMKRSTVFLHHRPRYIVLDILVGRRTFCVRVLFQVIAQVVYVRERERN